MTTRPIGRRAYLWMLLPAVAGLGTCAQGFASLSSAVAQMPRAPAAGGTVVLTPGEYIVYFEAGGPSVRGCFVSVEGSTSEPESACSITATDTGVPVPVRRSGSTTSYTLESYSGQSGGEIDIPTTGVYRVTCTGGDAATIAFGTSLLATVLASIIGGLVALFGPWVVWGIIYSKRRFRSIATHPAEPRHPPASE